MSIPKTKILLFIVFISTRLSQYQFPRLDDFKWSEKFGKYLYLGRPLTFDEFNEASKNVFSPDYNSEGFAFCPQALTAEESADAVESAAAAEELAENIRKAAAEEAVAAAARAAAEEPAEEPAEEELERAREDDGTFKADDPETPDTNEAFQVKTDTSEEPASKFTAEEQDDLDNLHWKSFESKYGMKKAAFKDSK